MNAECFLLLNGKDGTRVIGAMSIEDAKACVARSTSPHLLSIVAI